MAEQVKFKVYGYRWMVLFAFMLVVMANQLSWITFAPITSEAVAYYHVSDLSIGLLSMSFMIVYLFVTFPASWVIDTYGLRVAVGIGAALTGVFGIMRGLAASNFTLVMVAQIGLAVAQPFVLNAVTTVAARWFPVSERATASGLGSLAIYLGILIGIGLTPYLTAHYGMGSMLTIYGVILAITAVVFFVFARERPPTAPCPPEMEARSLVLDGLKDTLRNGQFILLMAVFFVGLGTFNAVTTWIEDIIRPRGFTTTEAGITGSMMIIGGILGAVILPTLSDRFRRRTPFILIAIAGATFGLFGVTFAGGYTALMASAFILGFFLLSAGPIGFQYGAEITYPAPEGTSNGLLLLMGQVSGILFIFAMDSFKVPGTGSMTPSLIVLIVLLFVCLLLSIRFKEPKALLLGGESQQEVQSEEAPSHQN